MVDQDPPPSEFDDEFDDEFVVGVEARNRAFFGTNVLRGLIEGIDDFVYGDHDRWQRRAGFVGPVLLGSALWIDDPELIDKVATLSAACIIVTKQPRNRPKSVAPLVELNQRTPGMPTSPFPELDDLAPRADGMPAVIGPYDSINGVMVPTIRTLGYRRVKHQVPLLHAKMALLGDLWWRAEDRGGYDLDVLHFTPQRLWISSANFTRSSRNSLEVGHWTEDRQLLEGAQRFLGRLIASSEGLDPQDDRPMPDLVGYEFDDEAMAEAIGERWPDEAEGDAPSAF